MRSSVFAALRYRPPLMLFALAIAMLISALLTVSPVRAQSTSDDGIWSDLVESSVANQNDRPIIPQKYRLVALDLAALQAQLAQAPQENSEAARNTARLLSLPLPDGTFGRFRIVESPIMAPELAAQFPAIKTYAGQGVDDPTATLRFDWTPAGFHALLIAAGGTVYIDPYQRNDTTTYISYYKRDFIAPTTKKFTEQPPLVLDAQRDAALATLAAQGVSRSVGTQLRRYRLAVAATGEYTQFHGGTVNQALGAIVTSINRVSGVYEREVAVRLTLVANNNLIIYTNPNGDPYTNDDPGALLDENQAIIDSVIGNNNYDVGHVFSTGGGGLAALGVPCVTGWKAQGETGSSSPVGDPFDIDYVAHELGHQFGANHTFNGNAGACNGNGNGSTAYEPGSGSTIMAYAGICGAQDLQPNSDDDFHSVSFDEIVIYTTQGDGNSCATITNTGNTPPVPDAGASYTIPKQTPFTLTGSATDANNDPLTYEWEEFDLGSAGASSSTNPPFFRSFVATTSASRTFPKWSNIINNTTTIGEILPNTTRTMNFRFIARDNRSGGGGVNYDSTTVNVTTAAGPFLVTAPNTVVTWNVGSTQNVTWNVAGTNSAPVNCATVNLRLSTDGGQTYPVALASGVPNNGSASITVPAQNTTSARVQVACAGNIFFDISNVNFTISGSGGPTATPTRTPTLTPTPTGTVITPPTATPTATPNAPAAVINLSSSSNGTVSGLSYKDEDILSYTGSSGWSMLFDGSDVGVGNTDVDAFHLMADGSILMSFDKPINLSTLGLVADADIVKFTPTQLGNTTSGSFSLYFDGSDVELTTANEDIDAIALDAGGNLVLSTLGSFSVLGLSGADEDLFRFVATSLGSNTSGSWSLLFDGSDVALTAGAEDLDGTWIDPANSKLYLATRGDFSAVGSVNSVSGDNNDIFGCTPLSTGANTNCNFFTFFNGDGVGFSQAIDGISLDLDVSARNWQQFVRPSAADESTTAQFAVLPDEAAEVDSELDEYDQSVEEEGVIRQQFLPLITR